MITKAQAMKLKPGDKLRNSSGDVAEVVSVYEPPKRPQTFGINIIMNDDPLIVIEECAHRWEVVG